VSVAAPILGSKVVLVASFTVTLLGTPLSGNLWAAAVLAMLGIAVLRLPGGLRAGSNLRLTVGFAVTSAACFALADILVQRWVTPANFSRFLPAIYLLAGAWSLVLVPFFREGLGAIPRRVWGYLLPGGLLMALQAMVFVYGLSRFGQATALNVLYNTRGLWSVLIVWVAGGWFDSEEAQVGHRGMATRLVGSLLLVAAVVLVVR
jgi:drug/metabolite transporter (DMT)-like permease